MLSDPGLVKIDPGLSRRDQLLALCERQPGGKAYFGFAPIISKKANQN